MARPQSQQCVIVIKVLPLVASLGGRGEHANDHLCVGADDQTVQIPGEISR